MSVAVNSSFERGYAGSLDADDVVADITARNAIIAGKRYLGMSVHVIDSDGLGLAMNYQLVGGLLDANWTEFAGGGSGTGFTNDLQGGALLTLTPTTKYVRVFGDGITPVGSIEGVTAGTEGQELVIMNYSGTDLTILHDASIVDAECLIHAGLSSDLVIQPFCSASYVYDEVQQDRWILTAVSDPSRLANSQIKIGTGLGDVIIVAHAAGVVDPDFPPVIKFDSTLQKWVFTNDGAVAPVALGSSIPVVATVTVSTTLDVSHEIVLVDATAGNITITLPTAIGVEKIYKVKKIDSSANTVTIDGNGAETIDGAATQVIYDQNYHLSLVSNQTNWSIF